MSNFLNSIIKAGTSADNQGWSGEPQNEPTEDVRFNIQPFPGDTGFSQWVTAMKMVAQLPGGIPLEFRKRLWLQLADKHLLAKGVDWPKVERTCFSEWSHPSDAELGVQIVKDLHRTGCSLFCGKDGQENQILLKRVLLAYARWNKVVGYCQGFNMLAALILQVTDKNEGDALKLMIYLVEGVLPESYFADNLRGLSVDMAVFRELLRTRFPRLSKHLETLQITSAKDGNRSYEPPLTNVFTMQWFLTLFCNCLPQSTVLRVWDLILLEGNEILLRTALAIWQLLADKILKVRSADEFYCVMGVLTRELLENELVDENTLIKTVVAIRPLTELNLLREHYTYNLTPWGTTLPQSIDKQIKLHQKQSTALDISGLKKQYTKLKQRQRQAQIIFSAAISRQSIPTPPVTMNHLLIGKNALIPAKRIGPPKGAIPPSRQTAPSTLHWKDAPKHTSSSSSSDTELCDDESPPSDDEDIKSDTDLMKNDNISAVLEYKRSDSPEYLFPDKDKVKDDDDDGSATQDDGVKFPRRNSELALQIMQENSLILHRILQCQSRFSPSPPLPEAIESNFNTNNKPNVPDDDTTLPELKSPEYGSRYSNILEKSKSLDEKYNELILNKPISKTFEGISSNFMAETMNKGKYLDGMDKESKSAVEDLITIEDGDEDKGDGKEDILKLNFGYKFPDLTTKIDTKYEDSTTKIDDKSPLQYLSKTFHSNLYDSSNSSTINDYTFNNTFENTTISDVNFDSYFKNDVTNATSKKRIDEINSTEDGVKERINMVDSKYCIENFDIDSIDSKGINFNSVFSLDTDTECSSLNIVESVKPNDIRVESSAAKLSSNMPILSDVPFSNLLENDGEI